jgi:IS5 family transposase
MSKALKIDNSQSKLFQNRLSAQLNLRHPIFIMSAQIDWNYFEQEFGLLYKDVAGQPPKPIRLMVGLMLLQHMEGLSDEEVVSKWVENPYWQYFYGYDFLQWELPIDPSSMVR